MLSDGTKEEQDESVMKAGSQETEQDAQATLQALYSFDGPPSTGKAQSVARRKKRTARDQHQPRRNGRSHDDSRIRKRIKGSERTPTPRKHDTFVYENLQKKASMWYEQEGRERRGKARRQEQGRGPGWGVEFNNKAGNFTATVGNFNSYYGYRRASMGPNMGHVLAPGVWFDPRLELMRSEWFEGNKCLDIGCNAGFLTMSMAYKFKCASMLGIDCDAALIAQARRAKKGIRWPSSSLSSSSSSEQSGSATAQNASGSASTKVYFSQQDFVQECPSEPETPMYDTITCLSVSKWVHLNHGDDGIRTLFRRCFNLLKDGGLLILEPQPWRSYHRRRNLTPEVRRNFEKIKITPDMFQNETLPSVGFSRVECLGSPANVSRGFRRPILLCHKGQPRNVDNEKM